MKQLSFLLFALLFLSACSAPTRSDKDDFFVVSLGNIPIDKIEFFVDCLSDGFQQSHSGITNFEVRQFNRANGYRVETYTGSFNYLLVSADVFNDGKVVLNESISAGWINTTGEKGAFANCLHDFTANGTEG
ncbi:hypothetical protein JK628_07520 [Shewanella sp. KX20019]|uniref:hypothetical protein n=1 Tax=Shewanella sp. KX20019 TaxID=2803864 RepID=UPI00192616DB|nr:hypothetical protein [Shewanella sp. KX20019]QQX81679.1 hypothetical protein JK628_07520 [Shewanella sp. KX20019]